MNEPKRTTKIVECEAWSVERALSPQASRLRAHELITLAAQSGEQPEQKSEADEVTLLASAGCSNEDIAVLVGCSEKKLHKRYNKLIARARAERRKQILANQNEAAAKGNATILIWLGKVELDQIDKKPRPEPVNAYLDAMDAASAEHDRADPRTPGPIEE
jgi:DNA-binding CsgD family transcriptional regulator